MSITGCHVEECGLGQDNPDPVCYINVCGVAVFCDVAGAKAGIADVNFPPLPPGWWTDNADAQEGGVASALFISNISLFTMTDKIVLT